MMFGKYMLLILANDFNLNIVGLSYKKNPNDNISVQVNNKSQTKKYKKVIQVQVPFHQLHSLLILLV